MEKDFTNLSPEQVEELAKLAHDFQVINGVVKNVVANNISYFQVVPFLLFPTAISQKHFQTATNLQKDFQMLFYQLSNNKMALAQCLNNSIETIPFLKRLWTLYEKV